MPVAFLSWAASMTARMALGKRGDAAFVLASPELGRRRAVFDFRGLGVFAMQGAFQVCQATLKGCLHVQSMLRNVRRHDIGDQARDALTESHAVANIGG